MATLNNPFKGINTQLGTAQRRTVGEDLASLVSTSLQGYAKVKEIDKKFTEEEDAQLNESAMVGYNSILEKHRQLDIDSNINGMDESTFAEYSENKRKEITDYTEQNKNVKWVQRNSAKLNGIYDEKISVAYKNHNIKLQNAYADSAFTTAVRNMGNMDTEDIELLKMSMNGGFDGGSDMSNESFVKGLTEYTVGYTNQIQNEMLSGNFKNYNKKEMEANKQSLLSYVKNPKLRAKIEAGYQGLTDTLQSHNGAEFKQIYLQELYGDKSSVWGDVHKRISKELRKTDMDDATRINLTARLEAIKNQSFGGDAKAYK